MPLAVATDNSMTDRITDLSTSESPHTQGLNSGAMVALLTPNDVMRLCGISRTTLWRWENQYGLQSINVGYTKRFRQSDLNEFLKRHESTDDRAKMN